VVAGRSTRSLDCIVTKKQRRLIYTWIAAAIIVGVGIAVDGTRYNSWFKPILYFGAFGLMVFERREGDRDGGTRLERIAREHPLFKWWLGLWALAIAANAVMASYSSVRILEHAGLGVIMGLLFVAIGPLVAAGEYEKFTEASDPDVDAI
jgi:hypothetical protein